MANARKSAPSRLLQGEPFMLLSEYFGNPFNYIVAPIAANSGNANEWALFDLQFDPALYLDATDADLRDAIDGTTKAIRRVSINAQPGLLPIDYAPDDVRGGRQPLETYLARAQAIRGHGEFRKRAGATSRNRPRHSRACRLEPSEFRYYERFSRWCFVPRRSRRHGRRPGRDG
jgi:hypothetical protein